MTQGYRSHFFSSCDNSLENTLSISEALRKSFKMRSKCSIGNDEVSNSRFSHCHHSTVSSWAMWKISAVQVFFMQATNSPVWLWLSAPVQYQSHQEYSWPVSLRATSIVLTSQLLKASASLINAHGF